MALFKSRKPTKPTKQRSCTGKAKMSKEIAKKKMGQVQRRGTLMYAYKCLYCKFSNGSAVWHIGHRR